MDIKSEYKHLFPVILEVEQGEKYTWCGCGKSTSQPLCDKTNSCEKAISFMADLTEALCLCNCKQTKTPPLCDGSHASLVLEALKNKPSKQE